MVDQADSNMITNEKPNKYPMDNNSQVGETPNKSDDGKQQTGSGDNINVVSTINWRSQSSEPIVELKHTSSSSNASSSIGESPKSGFSPFSSRQSSDCDESKQQLSNTSSSRLIRRRTVRRSYRRCKEIDSCDKNRARNRETLSFNAEETTIGDEGEKESQSEVINADHIISRDGEQTNKSIGEFSGKFTGRDGPKGEPIGVDATNQASKQTSFTEAISNGKIAQTSRSIITANRKSTTSKEQVISTASQIQNNSRSAIARFVDNSREHKRTQVQAQSTSSSSTSNMHSNIVTSSNTIDNGTGAIKSTRDNEPRYQFASERNLFNHRGHEAAAGCNFEPVADNQCSAHEELTHRRRFKLEQEESSVQHRESRFSSQSTGLGATTTLNNATQRQQRLSSTSTETSASLSRQAKNITGNNDHMLAESAATSHRFEQKSSSSSSLFVAGNQQLDRHGLPANECDQQVAGRQHPFINISDTIFSTPCLQSMVEELGTHFAELEEASAPSARGSGVSTVKRRLSPPSQSFNYGRPTTFGNEISSSRRLQIGGIQSILPAPDNHSTTNGPKIRELMSRTQELDNRCEVFGRKKNDSKQNEQPSQLPTKNTLAGSKLIKCRTIHRTNQVLQNSAVSSGSESDDNNQPPPQSLTSSREDRRKTVVSHSIEFIHQRMSELCKKLETCHNTNQAIELLKIMIQMIEKAWSVPVCGDDLGFKLCDSLRHAGGLDIILGFIHEADEQKLFNDSNEEDPVTHADKESEVAPEFGKVKADEVGQTIKSAARKPLPKLEKLHLAKARSPISTGRAEKVTDDQKCEVTAVEDDETLTLGDNSETKMAQSQTSQDKKMPNYVMLTKDNDSDIPTSDLGLDSASVESLTYISANQSSIKDVASDTEPTLSRFEMCSSNGENKNELDGSTEVGAGATEFARVGNEGENIDSVEGNSVKRDGGLKDNEEANSLTTTEVLQKSRQKELTFLSAQLLALCLSCENRDYIVSYGFLEPVIKLACKFTTIRCGSLARIMSSNSAKVALVHQKSSIKRSSSTKEKSTRPVDQCDSSATNKSSNPTSDNIDNRIIIPKRRTSEISRTNSAKHRATTTTTDTSHLEDEQQQQSQADLYSAIGTEILQHLFKHSEETCTRIIALGGLEAILYECRSTKVDTLRHCASALANLALYGGPDSQQTMIEQKAHVWLFPLAFNKDDNVQYYACLAIVVLAANQEIASDVLESGTLDLVEPFATTHEPRKFAESTTAHIHGQSANWLRKLVPLLESRREETRNLACFHFAMEAYIKREQGRTQVFKEIGAIEPLKKAGSSPIAIASKFACQALRLIGEKEPHRLSQQVPLWTIEDVRVWVCQVGFEKFGSAFKESHVDGDLLLQLDEDMLKTDIGIVNGILRRRFLRELSNLKRIADYSSVDRSGLSSLLVNSSNAATSPTGGGGVQTRSTPNGQPVLHGNGGGGLTSKSASTRGDFVQYIYPILQQGVTRDNIHLIDCDHLLAECRVTNAVHRMKLAHSIRELQDRILLGAASNERNPNCDTEQKTLDAFVSYRRSNGSQLASLLKVHLQVRGFSVFIDVERLEAGKFDNNLLDSIKAAKNFILVLSPNALDRCIDDHDCKDWVHKEIVAALASNCNIIPIIDNFHWPDPEQLPEDMRSIVYFNGVRWIHDYQEACVDKVERFIRGELNNAGSQSNSGTLIGGSSISSVIGVSGAGNGPNCYSKLSCNSANCVSTPSISATPSIINPSSGQYGASVGLRCAPATYTHEPDHHPLMFANGYVQQQQHISNTVPACHRR